MWYLNDKRKIFILIFVVHLLFLREGLFSNDEGAHYLLTRSLAENFPDFLDLSQYIRMPAGKGPYYSFFRYGDEVHAGVNLGLPALSSPFYLLFGRFGIKIFNLLAGLITSCAIFLAASRLYGRRHALLAAMLYVFVTPSLFYSTSLWNHTLTTLLFTLTIYIFLAYEDRSRDAVLFSLLAALTVLSSYYMIVPVSLLCVTFALRLRSTQRIACLACYLLFLLPAFAFNYFNFGSPLLGEYSVPGVSTGGSASPAADGAERLLKGLAALLISVDVSDHYYSFSQKAVFQSSPVLILSLLYILRSRRLLAVSASCLLLILMVAYHDGDFGGWQLSMRYVLPVFPFLTISFAGFLHRSGIEYELRRLSAALLFLTILALAFPFGPRSEEYLLIKIFSAFLALFLLLSSPVLERLNTGHVGNFVFLLIMFSALVNLNDAGYGASYRSAHAFIEESLEGAHDVVLFPADAPFAGLFMPDKLTVQYRSPGEIVRYLGHGNLTVISEDAPPAEGCASTTRSFGSAYAYLVREKRLRELLNVVEKYRIINLHCKS